jgi:hypothetical protein
MKKTTLALMFAFAGAAAVQAHAADVGVSVTVGQPGFYGHIDIGDFPQPTVIYPQPVIIQPVPVAGPPLYLRVPPGHYKHWNKHCAEYDACGRQVYFVRDSWYNNVYAPRYRERHGDEHDRDHHEGHDHDGDHGHGNGHGHGHGHDD